VPYVKEAGVIFAFYATGVIVFAYLGAFHIKESKYFTHEEDVVVPKHVLEEHQITGNALSTDGSLEAGEKVSEVPVEPAKHE